MSSPARQINDRRLIKYRDALENMPASGGGGCHVALLRVANFGRAANVARERIFNELRANIRGTRHVTDKEIGEAIDKAFQGSETYTPKPRIVAVNHEKLLATILSRGEGFTEADLWEASPIRLDWPPQEDALMFLGCMYSPEEKVFIGERYDATSASIHPVARWIKSLENGQEVPEFIITNPLTGNLGETKDGKPSYRADQCVAKFRFCMVEFDNRPLDWQIQFWAGARLPIAALVFSGNKSIHSWLRFEAEDVQDWEQNIEGNLFDLLRPLGVDSSSRNESRLARMPGHFRGENAKLQRILFLNPEGGPVQS